MFVNIKLEEYFVEFSQTFSSSRESESSFFFTFKMVDSAASMMYGRWNNLSRNLCETRAFMLVFFEYFHDSFFRTSCFQFPVMETSGNNHILRQKFARLRLIILR